MSSDKLTIPETELQLDTQDERVIVIDETGEIVDAQALSVPGKSLTPMVDEGGEFLGC